MNFPTPEEMIKKAYENHGLNQEQANELEMMVRHSMTAGNREIALCFDGSSSIGASGAFRFLRLMNYDVSYAQTVNGRTDPSRLIVKI